MEEKSLIGLDDKYIKILNYCSFFSQNDNDFNRVKKELSITRLFYLKDYQVPERQLLHMIYITI